MPAYYYKARNAQGEEQTGVRDAPTKLELAKALRGENLTLISAVPETEQKEGGGLGDKLSFLGGVSLDDKLMFTRNLRVMISSGVSLPDSMRTLAGQAQSEEFREALTDIADRLSSGENFSEAIGHYPDIFPDLFYHMVRVGEQSGTLETSLENLTMHMRRQHEIKSQIKGAMIYPAVIVGVMVIIAILMLTLVVPKLAGVFEEMGVSLPATTKFVIAAGEFMRNNALIVLLAGAVTAVGFKLLYAAGPARRAWSTVSLYIPILGPLVKKTNASYIMRTLSVLIASGVSFVRSLDIVAGVVPNIHYKRAMSDAQERIQRGEQLSDILREYPGLFPSTVMEMMEVGEQTGETSEVLEDLAGFYEEEVEQATKNLVSMIEPLLMVIIGAVVGFFAISMIQPMYSMLGQF